MNARPGRQDANQQDPATLTALLALYQETWGEIARLREYEWKIAYYFLILSGGVFTLVVNPGMKSLLTPGLRWFVTMFQVIAMFLGVVYLEITHDYLTRQRGIRRDIERMLGFYDGGTYGTGTILPVDWKTQGVTKQFQRAGLVLPLMATVVLAQALTIFVAWSRV